jgi:uncharacterized protein
VGDLTPDEAARVLARLHDAQRTFYAGGDPRELEGVLAPDVVWHVPGRSAIAGTYRGIEHVLEYMARRRDLADQTFTMHPLELLVGEHHAASITAGEARREGRVQTWLTVGLYRIRDGRVLECRLLPFDQEQFDRIWRA